METTIDPHEDDYEEGEVFDNENTYESVSSVEDFSSDEVEIIDNGSVSKKRHRRKEHKCSEKSLCRTERSGKNCYVRRKTPSKHEVTKSDHSRIKSTYNLSNDSSSTAYSSAQQTNISNYNNRPIPTTRPESKGFKGWCEKENSSRSPYFPKYNYYGERIDYTISRPPPPKTRVPSPEFYGPHIYAQAVLTSKETTSNKPPNRQNSCPVLRPRRQNIDKVQKLPEKPHQFENIQKQSEKSDEESVQSTSLLKRLVGSGSTGIKLPKDSEEQKKAPEQENISRRSEPIRFTIQSNPVQVLQPVNGVIDLLNIENSDDADTDCQDTSTNNSSGQNIGIYTGETASQDDQEVLRLRMEALKSAVLKKFKERKKQGFVLRKSVDDATKEDDLDGLALLELDPSLSVDGSRQPPDQKEMATFKVALTSLRIASNVYNFNLKGIISEPADLFLNPNDYANNYGLLSINYALNKPLSFQSPALTVFASCPFYFQNTVDLLPSFGENENIFFYYFSPSNSWFSVSDNFKFLSQQFKEEFTCVFDDLVSTDVFGLTFLSTQFITVPTNVLQLKTRNSAKNIKFSTAFYSELRNSLVASLAPIPTTLLFSSVIKTFDINRKIQVFNYQIGYGLLRPYSEVILCGCVDFSKIGIPFPKMNHGDQMYDILSEAGSSPMDICMLSDDEEEESELRKLALLSFKNRTAGATSESSDKNPNFTKGSADESWEDIDELILRAQLLSSLSDKIPVAHEVEDPPTPVPVSKVQRFLNSKVMGKKIVNPVDFKKSKKRKLMEPMNGLYVKQAPFIKKPALQQRVVKNLRVTNIVRKNPKDLIPEPLPPPPIQVPRLVITVNGDSSDDEVESPVKEFPPLLPPPQPPIGLPSVSPLHSPPAPPNLDHNPPASTTQSKDIEIKLDQLLKEARCKTQSSPGPSNPVPAPPKSQDVKATANVQPPPAPLPKSKEQSLKRVPAKTPVSKPITSTKSTSTPLAVTHLSMSQQEEYRRLKQKIAEKEKQLLLNKQKARKKEKNQRLLDQLSQQFEAERNSDLEMSPPATEETSSVLESGSASTSTESTSNERPRNIKIDRLKTTQSALHLERRIVTQELLHITDLLDCIEKEQAQYVVLQGRLDEARQQLERMETSLARRGEKILRMKDELIEHGRNVQTRIESCSHIASSCTDMGTRLIINAVPGRRKSNDPVRRLVSREVSAVGHNVADILEKPDLSVSNIRELLNLSGRTVQEPILRSVQSSSALPDTKSKKLRIRFKKGKLQLASNNYVTKALKKSLSSSKIKLVKKLKKPSNELNDIATPPRPKNGQQGQGPSCSEQDAPYSPEDMDVIDGPASPEGSSVPVGDIPLPFATPPIEPRGSPTNEANKSAPAPTQNDGRIVVEIPGTNIKLTEPPKFPKLKKRDKASSANSSAESLSSYSSGDSRQNRLYQEFGIFNNSKKSQVTPSGKLIIPLLPNSKNDCGTSSQPS